jgi:hypothetical protein
VPPSSPSCRCGSSTFTIFPVRVEGVAVVKCVGGGHSSYLLDSADYWADIIQDRRPRALKCACGSDEFRLRLEYDFREGTVSVRGVHVGATCARCSRERDVLDVEVDYEPTEALVESPLVAVDNPWQQPKRVSITALWTPAAFDAAIEQLVETQGATAFLLEHGKATRPAGRAEIEQAHRSERYFRVWFTVGGTAPADERDPWKTGPYLQLGSPTVMNYAGGQGRLYYVEYAPQTRSAQGLIPQAADFLALCQGFREWLSRSFISSRGALCFDEPSEYARLFGGGPAGRRQPT